MFVATAGGNVEERIQQISRSRNKIGTSITTCRATHRGLKNKPTGIVSDLFTRVCAGSGPALTQRMEDWQRNFIQREKRRRIHEAEEALEQQEANRRQMFKVSCLDRSGDSRIVGQLLTSVWVVSGRRRWT